jgi:sulfur-oxidizing protein SoxY
MSKVDRRSVLIGSAALLAAGPAVAQMPAPEPAFRDVFGDRVAKPGRITMQLSPIAENGNSVPIALAIDEAPGRVRRIVLLATGNPYPLAAEYRFGPRAAKTDISTRIRLARSQVVTAVAELADGSLWSASTDVVVTAGACAEPFGN